MERSGAGGRGAGTKRTAGVTELSFSAERLVCRSRSAHMLCKGDSRTKSDRFRLKWTSLEENLL